MGRSRRPGTPAPAVPTQTASRRPHRDGCAAEMPVWPERVTMGAVILSLCLAAMRELLHFATRRHQELVDITEAVTAVVGPSGIADGLVHVHAQGATAAVMIQENWDESVQEDVIDFLSSQIPQGVWKHDMPGTAMAMPTSKRAWWAYPRRSPDCRQAGVLALLRRSRSECALPLVPWINGAAADAGAARPSCRAHGGPAVQDLRSAADQAPGSRYR